MDGGTANVHGWTGRKIAPAFSALPTSMCVGRKIAPAFSALPTSMWVVWYCECPN